LWALVAVGVFVVPAEAFVPILIWLVVFDRHTLEAQPEGRSV
jgi:hypothetical protein